MTPGQFDEDLPARADAPFLVRQRFRKWARELSWPTQEVDDLLIALSEAVSNACEHAYPPGNNASIRVRAHRREDADGRQRLVITVSDLGAWRDPPAEDNYRRRGIPMMRATTDGLRIDPSATGTRVILTSRPVGPGRDDGFVATPRRAPKAVPQPSD